MLHPLNVVACEAEMMRLVQFQRGLLSLAIHLKNGAPISEGTFRVVLGDNAGAWFWEVYGKDGAWTSKFDILCANCPSLANGQILLLEAFDWDVQFHDHFTNETWSFKFPSLNLPLKGAIKQLFEHCYNYLGAVGYKEAIHGTPGLVLTRDQFLKNYKLPNGNIKVCPVCDGAVEEHAYKDIPILTLDHFFPKAQYPFLSLHPYNLIPACNTCNSTYKGEKDPLIDHTIQQVPIDALVNSYHAYRNRAILTLDKIRAFRSVPLQNELVVEIYDLTGTSMRRINTANYVYSLTARWSKTIRSKVYQTLVDDLCSQPQENPYRSKDDLLKDLRFEKNRCRRGKKSDDVLREAYLEYALTDATELKYLLERYTGRE